MSGDGTGSALANQVALTLYRMARTHDGRIGKTKNDRESSSSLSSAFRPRRFAVVITNGSVAKRSSAENEPIASLETRTGIPAQKNKPAMGRYWHVSDVGVWLEADASRGEAGTLPMSFYDNAPVVGLSTE